MNIITFTLKETDIDVTYRNGSLACTFQKDGKNYGCQTKPESKKVLDIAGAVCVLLSNAIESLEALNKQDDSTRTRTDA